MTRNKNNICKSRRYILTSSIEKYNTNVIVSLSKIKVLFNMDFNLLENSQNHFYSCIYSMADKTCIISGLLQSYINIFMQSQYDPETLSMLSKHHRMSGYIDIV